MIRKLILLFMPIFLVACSAQPTQDPNFILTVVSGTQSAAAYRTEMAELLFTSTPTLATLRPTITLQPTSTNFVLKINTRTPSPSPTRTPRLRTTWPDWNTGDVISMPSSSGASIGVNKKFSSLRGLMVIVVREYGVIMRPIPSKAIGGPWEERGSAFTLTGIMNQNYKYDWIFVQVIAADGKKYWVGGSVSGTENDNGMDPTAALKFYYPAKTPSVTPVPSARSTSTSLAVKTPTP